MDAANAESQPVFGRTANSLPSLRAHTAVAVAADGWRDRGLVGRARPALPFAALIEAN